MKTTATIAILLCWAAVFVYAWRDTNSAQWDFKAYYVAAAVYDQGQDPYNVKNLRAVAGGRQILPYYYPLSALYLLKPILSLSYESAHHLWVALKALALIGLLLVWKRAFLERTSWLLILTIALLGFQAAAIWDIKAGNITIFEELMMWAGFAFLLRSRVTAFVVCIVLAATFKLLPAAFLGLLLLPRFRTRANMLRMAGGGLALAAIVVLPFVRHPDYLSGFRHGLASAHPRLQYNPTFVGVMDELALHHKVFDAVWLKVVAIAAYYATVIAVSRPMIQRAYAGKSALQSILIATVMYALLVPRFMVYSYMIVMVAVLALVVPAVRKMELEGAAVVAAIGISGLSLLPLGVGEFLGGAVPFLQLLSCWLVLAAAR